MSLAALFICKKLNAKRYHACHCLIGINMIIEIVFLLVLALILYVILEYIDHVIKLKNYPPGPFPLPVIGNMHLMSREKPYETLRDLGKKYGDVFSISFGMHRIVVVNEIEAAREALITKSNDFAGRPNVSNSMKIFTRGYNDILLSEGPYWTLNHKLGYAALTMYGDGMGNLVSKVTSSSENLKERLKEAEGKPVDVHLELGLCVVNILCSVVFGNHYSRDDEEFADVINFLDLMYQGLSDGDPAAFFPWLRFFPLKGITKLKQAMKIRDPFLRKKLKEHRETFDPEKIRDFTDSLIKSSQDESLWEKVGVKKVNDDDHIEMIINDLFSAGSETTTTCLRWMTVYFLHWPRIQEKVYNEIIQVVGLDRYPDLQDRTNLPLMMATIQETLRLASLGPLSVPHKSTKDSSISGQFVPKDTQILFNLWNLHHDPAEWENPEHFDPHRWLDEEGKFVPGRHRSFLPFSAGPRVCLGESMAKIELFLLFSRLIKDFKIKQNPDEPMPSLQGMMIYGLTLAPRPFTVIFASRE